MRPLGIDGCTHGSSLNEVSAVIGIVCNCSLCFLKQRSHVNTTKHPKTNIFVELELDVKFYIDILVFDLIYFFLPFRISAKNLQG